MKINLAKYFVILAWLLIFGLSGCKKQDTPSGPVTVIEMSVTDIGIGYVLVHGEVISNGGLEVSGLGFCWSTHKNPTEYDKYIFGTQSGSSYTGYIIGLTLNTTYYIRVFSLNSAGTTYGNQVTVKTPAGPPTVPTVSTVLSRIFGGFMDTYATLSVTITSDGGSPITAAGICWSKKQNPTLSDSVWNGNIVQGVFSTSIYLPHGITYYSRAFATNAHGTVYGNQVSVTNAAIITTVHTSVVLTVSPTEAITGGYDLYDGGSTVTDRGVCWSTSPDPTISNNKTSNGAGSGNFNSNITGLTPNTTYYFRAYAANSVGIGYGETYPYVLEQFNGPTVTDIDGNIYHTVTIGTQVWMVENLRTTRYSNGDPIPRTAVPNDADRNIGNYSDYNNDATNSVIYGRLYNWFAATDNRKIAPDGWHVPSAAEWTTLMDYLTNNGYGFQGNSSSIAKSLAAKTGWTLSAPTYQAGEVYTDQTKNNSSGFTALPGGVQISDCNTQQRCFYLYMLKGFLGEYWSTSAPDAYNNASTFEIDSHSSIILKRSGGIYLGYSVRCIKD